VTGCESANALANDADVVLAVGSRLEDFTTGSWTVFQDPDVRIVGLNAARFDAHKRRSLPLVADAREGLLELDAALGAWRTTGDWTERAASLRIEYHAYIYKIAAPTDAGGSGKSEWSPTPRSSAPSTATNDPVTTRSPRPAGSPARSTTAGVPMRSTASTVSMGLVHGLRDLRRMGRQDGDA